MNNLEKLRVLLPHWIEHNASHGHEFDRWAHLFQEVGYEDLAALLKNAAVSLQSADASLREALHLSGGELLGHESHHHDHHNLPE